MTLPDRPALDVERLRAAPAPWSITVVPASPSTNTDLLAVASSSPEGTVLVAEHQTAGLGRLGREWNSPDRSSLTVSVLLRPTVDVARWGWLPLLAGVALCDTVAALGVTAVLKWPNDLLLGPDEHKSAGILAQVSGDAVVIGIGVNVTTTTDELPIPTATSLSLAGASSVDRSELLLDLLARLGDLYHGWIAANGDAEASGLAATYRQRCVTIGREVSVSTVSGSGHHGTALDVDGDGRLIVRTAEADLPVAAGDVQHVRPINHTEGAPE